ncbi:hypothetical protein [Silvimonas amylolytica]|uniref:Uncharacterized protein n=1 Tax=Silvimonas amylolytica TaxID=449663 RepID=A0ABQ2PPZ9_9NEIS|nr:hypothetical protein [Silvimonas amylolytica]GGP27324.1 hypothetical protein GCM10010971_31430 [Silvimonas amylolytica]
MIEHNAQTAGRAGFAADTHYEHIAFGRGTLALITLCAMLSGCASTPKDVPLSDLRFAGYGVVSHVSEEEKPKRFTEALGTAGMIVGVVAGFALDVAVIAMGAGHESTYETCDHRGHHSWCSSESSHDGFDGTSGVATMLGGIAGGVLGYGVGGIADAAVNLAEPPRVRITVTPLNANQNVNPVAFSVIKVVEDPPLIVGDQVMIYTDGVTTQISRDHPSVGINPVIAQPVSSGTVAYEQLQEDEHLPSPAQPDVPPDEDLQR